MSFFKKIRTKKNRSKDEIEVVIKTDLKLSDEQEQIITSIVLQGTKGNLYPFQIANNISIRMELSQPVSLCKSGNVITVFI